MTQDFACGVSYERLLVCGGRDYTDEREMGIQLQRYSPTVVIHGGARGADMLADRVARMFGMKVVVYKADWDKHGKSAGVIRNIEMLKKGKPDAVLAFPGGRGTAHMVSIAEKSGVTVIKVPK